METKELKDTPKGMTIYQVKGAAPLGYPHTPNTVTIKTIENHVHI